MVTSTVNTAVGRWWLSIVNDRAPDTDGKHPTEAARMRRLESHTVTEQENAP
jgi:hypothetical protein